MCILTPDLQPNYEVKVGLIQKIFCRKTDLTFSKELPFQTKIQNQNWVTKTRFIQILPPTNCSMLTSHAPSPTKSRLKVVLISHLMVRIQIIVQKSTLKGHSQLVHMHIRNHFLADLHITLHHKSRAERRIL